MVAWFIHYSTVTPPKSPPHHSPGASTDPHCHKALFFSLSPFLRPALSWTCLPLIRHRSRRIRVRDRRTASRRSEYPQLLAASGISNRQGNPPTQSFLSLFTLPGSTALYLLRELYRRPSRRSASLVVFSRYPLLSCCFWALGFYFILFIYLFIF